MHITFILADYYGHQFTGSISKRSVTIELTPEQIEQVKPQKVGTKYSETNKAQIVVYEQYQEVFIDQKPQ